MEEQPPMQTPPPPEPKREPVGPDYWKPSRRRWPWLLLIGLILIAAIALYWLWQHPKKPAPASNNQTNSGTQTTTKATPPAVETTTQNYSSNNFNLSFDYPKDWTVTDSGNGQLTVRSPVVSLTGGSDQAVDGQIIMTISKKGQNLGVFDKGSATAVLDSQKVAYSNPTQAQRADTYLSFLQYANTTTTGALDSVDITGDYGYKKGQYIPKTDIAKIDPLVTVTFVKCASSACPAGTTTALSIASGSWSKPTFTPVVSMLKSLSFN